MQNGLGFFPVAALEEIAGQIEARERYERESDQATYEADCGPFHGRCPECGRHSAQDELCIDCEHTLQNFVNRG